MHNELNLHGNDPLIVELELLFDYSPKTLGELTILVEWYREEDGTNMGFPHELEWSTRHKTLKTYRNKWKQETK